MLKKTLMILTIGGLIPYLFLPILFITGIIKSVTFYPLFLSYGFGIICFLCGTLWPVNLAITPPLKATMIAIYSNIIMLLAWLGHAYLHSVVELLWQAFLIFLLWLIDCWLFLQAYREKWYFILRTGVSSLVILCLLFSLSISL